MNSCAYLLCYHSPKLEPRECKITSTRGISCLYKIEKRYNSVHFQQTWGCSPNVTAYLFPKTPYIGSHGYNMPWFAYVTPLACFIAVINDTRCIIRKRQTAWFPFRVVDILTANQCLVSHEHLISWTLVHCWNTGRTTLSAESIRCKCTNDTIRADKVSERWGVNT